MVFKDLTVIFLLILLKKHFKNVTKYFKKRGKVKE